MEFINNLKSEYARKCVSYETEKIRIEQKIIRLEKKLKKLERPHWKDHLVRPIIEEVVRRTPDIKWEEDKALNTFGMRCECPIFGDTAEGHTVGITFTKGVGIPNYDTGETHSQYNKNALGDLNGFNNISKPVESIDELILMVRKQEQDALEHSKRISDKEITNENIKSHE